MVDERPRWLGRGSRTAVLRLGAPLRSPHALRRARAVSARAFRATLSGAYDAEIACDRRPGRPPARRPRRPTAGSTDTLVVVVGDHGESLGEHREQTHGFFVYDATIHVPLIVAGPGVPTRVVAEPGAHRRRDADGRSSCWASRRRRRCRAVSLLPIRARQRLELLALSESWYPRFHYGWSELDGDPRRALQVHPRAPRRELYDLQDDPGRSERPGGGRPAAEPRRWSGRSPSCWRASGSRQAARGTAAASTRTWRNACEALGYVGGSVSPRQPRGAAARRSEGQDRRSTTCLKLAAATRSKGRLDEAIAKVLRRPSPQTPTSSRATRCSATSM